MSPLERDHLSLALAAVGPAEIALMQETEAFDSVAKGSRYIVIFGSGYLGKLAVSGARAAGLNVVAFADNNGAKWGTVIDGLPVLAPSEALSQYKADALFVVGIFNSASVRDQLRGLGCNRIVPFPMLFWRFPEFFPRCGLALPHWILGQEAAIRRGYEFLSDAQSREEFAAQIQWRCTLEYDCLPPPSPAIDTYYPPSLIRLSAEEVLVDCGAFDGDSIRMFLERSAGRFCHIYAVEPDPINRAALQSSLASLLEHGDHRATILPYALGDRSETVSFDITGTAGSHVSPMTGLADVECRRLDDILDRPAPTFIKMDIEGAEPKAIVGATQTIRAARPILAICSYHQCEHLWTLPALIKAALPEYNIYLRRHAEECWEMVYYAIPPERTLHAN